VNFLQETFDIYQHHDNQYNLILMMDNVLSYLKGAGVKIRNFFKIKILGIL
jgi:hypothetical protein